MSNSNDEEVLLPEPISYYDNLCSRLNRIKLIMTKRMRSVVIGVYKLRRPVTDRAYHEVTIKPIRNCCWWGSMIVKRRSVIVTESFFGNVTSISS